MKFVQLIEFQSSRLDEFNALMDEWEGSTAGKENLPTRASQCADRDRPGTYVHIVEFPSYEAAMANSNRPETAEFAERLQKLCDGPAVFRNLDVLRQDDLG